MQQGRRREILVLEDEVIIAQSIKRSIVPHCDVTVHLAYDALTALTIAEKRPIDLLIADIGLGNGVDGIDVAKALDDQRDIPVLFLTSYHDDKTLQRASKLDIIAYLVKPFRMEELLVNLRLSRHHQTKEDISFWDLGNGYRLNEKSERLFRGDDLIRLTEKEQTLFMALVKAKGNVLTNAVIDDMFWPDKETTVGVRRQLVYRLKRKIPTLEINVIKDIGYQLNIQ